MILNVRRAVTTTKLRGMAPVMAALLLLFCLSSAAPALAGENGCQGSESSARICGQSGIADPSPVAVQPTVLVQGDREATAPFPVQPIALSAPQFHADPSAPRAPPFSLF